MLALLLFLLIGLTAGWLAGQVMRGGGFGLVGDLVLGVLGAFVGGWLLARFGLAFGGLIGSLFAAFFGAVVLIALVRIVKHA